MAEQYVPGDGIAFTSDYADGPETISRTPVAISDVTGLTAALGSVDMRLEGIKRRELQILRLMVTLVCMLVLTVAVCAVTVAVVVP